MPEPLVKHIYTADPSAHAFAGKIYVYPSHDRETDIQFNDNGDQYDMVDYHVLSMDEVGGEVTDHGVALSAEQVPWVDKQMWAPDCAEKDGKYYFYFPARAKDGEYGQPERTARSVYSQLTPQASSRWASPSLTSPRDPSRRSLRL